MMSEMERISYGERRGYVATLEEEWGDADCEVLSYASDGR
jgi:hypothetical protein